MTFNTQNANRCMVIFKACVSVASFTVEHCIV